MFIPESGSARFHSALQNAYGCKLTNCFWKFPFYVFQYWLTSCNWTWKMNHGSEPPDRSYIPVTLMTAEELSRCHLPWSIGQRSRKLDRRHFWCLTVREMNSVSELQMTSFLVHLLSYFLMSLSAQCSLTLWDTVVTHHLVSEETVASFLQAHPRSVVRERYVLQVSGECACLVFPGRWSVR